MNKFVALATLAVFALVPVVTHGAQMVKSNPEIAAPIGIIEGRMVYAVDGQRLAPVYRVNTDGSVQMIMARRLLTIPATIVSDVNGKLVSSQNKRDLLR